MSGKRFLLDSNIIIYIAKGLINLDDIIINNCSYSISVITKMEVLGFNFTNKDEELIIHEIIDQFYVLYIDRAISERVISLRKKSKIKLPDAIICATAIENGATLYSNDKRLGRIKDLDIKSFGETSNNKYRR